MNAISPASASLALLRMLADVADAARTPIDERDGAVATALSPYVGDPGLLAGRRLVAAPDCYARHLLFKDDSAGYAVAAIVWMPGQMSPVHGHRTWCGLGVHSGLLTETFYRVEAGVAQPVGCVARRSGDVSHAPASPHAVHRIANLGTEQAISVHCYGVRYDAFTTGVNHVWAQ